MRHAEDFMVLLLLLRSTVPNAECRRMFHVAPWRWLSDIDSREVPGSRVVHGFQVSRQDEGWSSTRTARFFLSDLRPVRPNNARSFVGKDCKIDSFETLLVTTM